VWRYPRRRFDRPADLQEPMRGRTSLPILQFSVVPSAILGQFNRRVLYPDIAIFLLIGTLCHVKALNCVAVLKGSCPSAEL
jgi:hypothetical protein